MRTSVVSVPAAALCAAAVFTSMGSAADGARWIPRTLPGGSLAEGGRTWTYPAGPRLLLRAPAGPPRRVLVLLHGWNQAAAEWTGKTRAAELADRHACVLVCPEMGGSNYESAFYPETQLKHPAVPGTHWIGAVLVPWLARTWPGLPVSIAGVSTGARGALLVAEHYPAAFRGVGYLSGDFDIELLADRLSELSYGPLARFRERWARDNTRRLAPRLAGKRVFAAHAFDDSVTPWSQTALLRTELARLGVANQVVFARAGGHTWRFWDSQLPALFAFLFPRD